VAEPVILELDEEPVTERYVEILETDGGRVITTVEIVSPANKLPGAGQQAYLRKRRELLASQTHLVEIDLVRAGNAEHLLEPHRVPLPYRTPYRVSISRAAQRRRLELYPITLQEPLPTIPIPLRPQDDEVALDLQALIARAYPAGMTRLTMAGPASRRWKGRMPRGRGNCWRHGSGGGERPGADDACGSYGSGGNLSQITASDTRPGRVLWWR
jgi:hypothetical protein